MCIRDRWYTGSPHFWHNVEWISTGFQSPFRSSVSMRKFSRTGIRLDFDKISKSILSKVKSLHEQNQPFNVVVIWISRCANVLGIPQLTCGWFSQIFVSTPMAGGGDGWNHNFGLVFKVFNLSWTRLQSRAVEPMQLDRVESSTSRYTIFLTGKSIRCSQSEGERVHHLWL